MFLLSNVAAVSSSMPEGRFPGLERIASSADALPVLGCALVTIVMFVCAIRWLARSAVLWRAKKADEKFTTEFRASAHALSVFQGGGTVAGSPRSALYTNACRELAFHLLGTDTVDKSFAMKLRAAGRITPSQWQATQRAARRSLDETARWFRSGLSGGGVKSLLGLGLLATLLSMINHAGEGTLDIAAAASSARPFVFALFFHVIGTVWHRYVVRSAEDSVADLEEFSTELGMLFERSFVDHRQPMETLPSLVGMGFTDGPAFDLTPSESGGKG